MTDNEEDYVHPAHCGVQSCRKEIQLMRAKHFLNAVQRAGEHRRVLAAYHFLFLIFILNIQIYVRQNSIRNSVVFRKNKSRKNAR